MATVVWVFTRWQVHDHIHQVGRTVIIIAIGAIEARILELGVSNNVLEGHVLVVTSLNLFRELIRDCTSVSLANSRLNLHLAPL